MSTCDAIGSVMQAKQDKLAMQINIAVLAKGLEATQVQGGAMVELLQAATEINQQLGVGLEFDARA